MLRSISSAHAKSCITFLLWAHIPRMAIARQVVVDDSETDKIIYSNGWAGYPNCVGCMQAPDLALPHVYNGTWHSWDGFSYLSGDLNFSFKFNGTRVDVHLFAECPNSSLMVVYSIDEGGMMAPVYQCLRRGFSYDQTLFSVRGLSNEEHILKVASTVPFLFDYLVYETEGPNGTLADTSTTTSLSTSLNPTSSNLEMIQESNASWSQGAIIGGAVSAVVLLVLGITLFLFLKCRRRARLSEKIAPYVEDTSFGVTTPGLRNFTGRPKRYSLNTITPVADEPVEAGLMSLEVNDPT